MFSSCGSFSSLTLHPIAHSLRTRLLRASSLARCVYPVLPKSLIPFPPFFCLLFLPFHYFCSSSHSFLSFSSSSFLLLLSLSVSLCLCLSSSSFSLFAVLLPFLLFHSPFILEPLSSCRLTVRYHIGASTDEYPATTPLPHPLNPLSTYCSANPHHRVYFCILIVFFSLFDPVPAPYTPTHEPQAPALAPDPFTFHNAYYTTLLFCGDHLLTTHN